LTQGDNNRNEEIRMQIEDAKPRRLLRNADLDKRGIMSRVNRWRGVKAGTFPAPVEIGPNSVAWYEDEVDAWLAELPRRTYGTLTRSECKPLRPMLPENASPNGSSGVQASSQQRLSMTAALDQDTRSHTAKRRHRTRQEGK
jgi:predicted DNA-binding transcriptional regulator AlpA